MSRRLTQLASLTILLTFIWFTVSYLEITAKNDKPNPVYSEHNLIRMIFDAE